MKAGDIVVTGRYGSRVPLLNKTIEDPPPRDTVCHLNKGDLALVVQRRGSDILLLAPGGVGWTWLDNVEVVQ